MIAQKFSFKTNVKTQYLMIFLPRVCVPHFFTPSIRTSGILFDCFLWLLLACPSFCTICISFLPSAVVQWVKVAEVVTWGLSKNWGEYFADIDMSTINNNIIIELATSLRTPLVFMRTVCLSYFTSCYDSYPLATDTKCSYWMFRLLVFCDLINVSAGTGVRCA